MKFKFSKNRQEFEAKIHILLDPPIRPLRAAGGIESEEECFAPLKTKPAFGLRLAYPKDEDLLGATVQRHGA